MAKPGERESTIVLGGVPWEAYVRVGDALAECHARHTYHLGALELPRVLRGVPWKAYQAVLAALPATCLRHTYRRGTLEMMSPLKHHEWVKTLLGRMVEAMTFALDIPIQSLGSTTLRSDPARSGLQPDEAYYIAHEAQARGRDDYDPAVDPPPDLVIEVDDTSSSLPRLPVFAALRAPEIWRHARGKLSFLALASSGAYQRRARSVSFPFLAARDVERFLNTRSTRSEHEVVRAFVAFAQAAHARFKAESATPPPDAPPGSVEPLLGRPSSEPPPAESPLSKKRASAAPIPKKRRPKRS